MDKLIGDNELMRYLSLDETLEEEVIDEINRRRNIPGDPVAVWCEKMERKATNPFDVDWMSVMTLPELGTEDQSVDPEQKLGTDQIQIHLNTGDNLRSELQYQMALKSYAKALIAAQHKYGLVNKETLAALRRVGYTLLRTGDYANSRKCLEQSVFVGTVLLGPLHDDLAPIMSDLAEVYMELGLFSPSEENYEQALLICNNSDSTLHLEKCRTLKNYGRMLLRFGYYPKAYELFSQAIEAYRTVTGERSKGVATTLVEMARVNLLLSKYEEGMNCCDTALSIYQELDEENHNERSILLIMMEQGLIWEARGEYDKARQILADAVKIAVKVRRDEQDTIDAQCVSHVARIQEMTGLHDEAVQLYQQVAGIYTQVYGVFHQETIDALTNLSGSFISTNRLEEAGQYAEYALQGARKLYETGTDNNGMARSLNNIACVYAKMGDYEESASLFEESLSTLRKLLPEDHPFIGVTLNNIGVMNAYNSRWAEAEKYVRASIEILDGGNRDAAMKNLESFAKNEHGQFLLIAA